MAEVTRQVYSPRLALLNDGNYLERSDRSTLDRVKCMLLQTGNESCVDIWNPYGGAICSSAGKALLERGVCFLRTAEDRSLGELWKTRQITSHSVGRQKTNSKWRRGSARDQR